MKLPTEAESPTEQSKALYAESVREFERINESIQGKYSCCCKELEIFFKTALKATLWIWDESLA